MYSQAQNPSIDKLTEHFEDPMAACARLHLSPDQLNSRGMTAVHESKMVHVVLCIKHNGCDDRCVITGCNKKEFSYCIRGETLTLYHCCFSLLSFSICDTIRAPCRGGLEYIGLAIACKQLRCHVEVPEGMADMRLPTSVTEVNWLISGIDLPLRGLSWYT